MLLFFVRSFFLLQSSALYRLALTASVWLGSYKKWKFKWEEKNNGRLKAKSNVTSFSLKLYCFAYFFFLLSTHSFSHSFTASYSFNLHACCNSAAVPCNNKCLVSMVLCTLANKMKIAFNGYWFVANVVCFHCFVPAPRRQLTVEQQQKHPHTLMQLWQKGRKRKHGLPSKRRIILKICCNRCDSRVPNVWL